MSDHQHVYDGDSVFCTICHKSRGADRRTSMTDHEHCFEHTDGKCCRCGLALVSWLGEQPAVGTPFEQSIVQAVEDGKLSDRVGLEILGYEGDG